MRKKKGFTLIELLVVVTILAILIVLGLSLVGRNRDKAADAKVKSDLSRLKIAFEDYYGDHNCYPPPEWFDEAGDCGSNVLAPYLNTLACNPKTGLPYAYVTDATGCVWFKLYGVLNVGTDSQALSSPLTIGSYTYNYGSSSDNVSLGNIGGGGTPLPPGHNYYWCSNIGNCTSFNYSTHTCTPSYTDNPNCDGGATPCQSIGSCTQL